MLELFSGAEKLADRRLIFGKFWVNSKKATAGGVTDNFCQKKASSNSKPQHKIILIVLKRKMIAITVKKLFKCVIFGCD